MWGENEKGEIGVNYIGERSSPVQVPGTNWSSVTSNGDGFSAGLKGDGTLWSWGSNNHGVLGLNQPEGQNVSSPTQIPGTTWSKAYAGSDYMLATKSDGTLWAWGKNDQGRLGINDVAKRSSPAQIPGTTWSFPCTANDFSGAIKSDGTMWAWGDNEQGQLGQNTQSPGPSGGISSPVQIPGTTWSKMTGTSRGFAALKTDGTMWTMGGQPSGQLGQNNQTYYSSPVQIPGTTWNHVSGSYSHYIATKTDGTLWAWGYGTNGQLGQNQTSGNSGHRSSPVQITGTTWAFATTYLSGSIAVKTDGTLWVWGANTYGECAQNSTGNISSPVQIPGTDWDTTGKWNQTYGAAQTVGVIKNL